jgi:ankyrin repeat protein
MSPENPTNRVLANAALWEASRQGDIGGIRAALADGADGLDTALIQAAKNGHVAAIHYLIDHGAAPDGLRDAAPIVWAASWGHFKAVELLLDSGASPNAEAFLGSWGRLISCASQEAIQNHYEEIARLLLRRGASPSKALDAAAKEGLVEIVQLALKAGAPLHSKSSALHQAATEGHVEVARALLKAGVDLGARDIAWQIAQQRGHSEFEALLRSHRQRRPSKGEVHLLTDEYKAELHRLECKRLAAEIRMRNLSSVMDRLMFWRH